MNRDRPGVTRLEATHLGCVRGGRPLFSGVSFSVGAGDALLVTGRNGTGKSSLLRIVAGLLRPTAGEVGLAGGDSERSLGEQTHYLGHLDALKPALRVAENLRFWCAYLGGKADAAEPALDAVGLASVSDLPAGYLSAGQRRRLSLARLVAVARPVWLLDEPTAALDTGGQALLAELMRAHLAGGGMVLAATHAPVGLDAAVELRLGEAA